MLVLPCALHVQGAAFVKIVAAGDQVPDRPPGVVFGGIPGGSAGPPGTEGGKVLFYADEIRGTTHLTTALWTANADGTGLVRIADRSTPVPDNSGTLYDHNPYELAGGRVVFRGHAYSPDHAGHYSAPAAGGTLIRLVDENTVIPGTTNRFGTLPIDSGEFHADGTNYVFAPGNLGAPILFVNVTTTHGQMRRFADSSMFITEPNYFPMNAYSRPDLSGSNVVALVGGGPTAIFLLPFSGLVTNTNGVVLNATRVASANTPVPGGPTNFHGQAFGTPRMDGPAVVFRGGWTTNGTDFTVGLYSWINGALHTLVDTATAVPGGTGNFLGFASLETYAVSRNHVVFVGRDATGREGIYHVPATGGSIRKVIAVGDAFPFGTVVGNPNIFYQPPMQANSLDGDSLVLRLDSVQSGGRSHNGIFLVNLAELLAPVLRIRVEGQDVLLRIDTSDAGARYQLQRRPTVAGGNWLDFGARLDGTGGPLEWRDTGRLAEGAQFYRVSISNP